MTDKAELHQALTDANNALALAAKAVKEAFEGVTHTPPAATAPSAVAPEASAAVEPVPTASSPAPDSVAAATPAADASAS